MIKNWCSLFILISLSTLFNCAFAQNPGASVLNADVLHEVRITLTQPDYWSQLINNYNQSGDGSNVPYIMGDVEIDGEFQDSIGVRLKGFTSFWTESDKKPIKLDFNEYVPGKRVDGLRKINLNNGTGDPGMQRDVLCYQMIRNMGVNAPRTAFTRVYINDVYWGVYQLIEQVDKEYLERNFPNPDGNLFKNKGWNNFEYLGNNGAEYDLTYDLKTNEEEYDWTGFINLMDKVNSLSDEEFTTEFAKIFNVELYLKILAVDVATDNWDSNLEHGRNWYMYEDDKTGQFQWIPWDYNFSMGGTFGGGGGDCFLWTDFGEFTNGTKTVEFQDFSFYSDTPTYAWDFGDGNTSNIQNPTHTYDQAGDYLVCLDVFIDQNCFESRCYNIDTDFDSNDCNSLSDNESPDQSNVFFQKVISDFPSCCQTWDGFCQDQYDGISGNASDSGFAIDQRDSERILINRILDVPQYYEAYQLAFCQLLKDVMVEDRLADLMDYNQLLLSDAVANDPNHLFSFTQFQRDFDPNISRSVRNYIPKRIEQLTTNLNDEFNCPNAQVAFSYQDVVINEIMASNDSTSTIFDQNGNHDDWIELYNRKSTALDLTGLYLSDDPADLLKWQIPDGTLLGADSYLVIWADKDEEQAGMHASFKLAKNGESIYLSNADGTAVDSMSYEDQITNVSYARYPNGSGEFRKQTATFNANNNVGTVSNNEVAFLNSVISPNPANHYVSIQLEDNLNDKKHLELYGADGKLIVSDDFISSSIDINTKALSPGLYILRVWNDQGKIASHKLVVQR